MMSNENGTAESNNPRSKVGIAKYFNQPCE